MAKCKKCRKPIKAVNERYGFCSDCQCGKNLGRGKCRKEAGKCGIVSHMSNLKIHHAPKKIKNQLTCKKCGKTIGNVNRIYGFCSTCQCGKDMGSGKCRKEAGKCGVKAHTSGYKSSHNSKKTGKKKAAKKRTCIACENAGHGPMDCGTPRNKSGRLESGSVVSHEGHPSEWRLSLCKCPGNGWINHWRSVSGSRQKKCAEKSCSENANDGAHVRIKGRKGIFIIPLCTSHNRNWQQKRGTEFEVKATTWVSANPHRSCRL